MAAMTYYHGMETPEIIFSGFNIWSWSRVDDLKLVDFVLQQIWQMPHIDAARWAPQGVARAVNPLPARAGHAGLPSAAGSRLPTARTAGR
jgi:hypothetical protein